MSYSIYIIFHLIGAFFVIFALGGSLLQAINTGNKNFQYKKVVGAIHGIGLLLLFVAGFGLIAKNGYSPIPIWVWIKIVIWGFYAIVSGLAFKKTESSKLLWVITLVLFIVVILLARLKPF